MQIHLWLKEVSLSEERGFGLDASSVMVEKFPIIVAPVINIGVKRLEPTRYPGEREPFSGVQINKRPMRGVYSTNTQGD